MFHLSERLSPSGTSRIEARRYLKRAFLFGAGLLLLWVSLQLLPSRTAPEQPPVYSDEAGTVASGTQKTPPSGTLNLFAPGNLVAILLLGGGVALAVHLRRRSRTGDAPTAITPLGEYGIGPNQSLRLVECANEVLLIGVTSGQVTLLRSYTADQFDVDCPEEGAKPSMGTHFADVLHRYAGQREPVETNGTTC